MSRGRMGKVDSDGGRVYGVTKQHYLQQKDIWKR